MTCNEKMKSCTGHYHSNSSSCISPSSSCITDEFLVCNNLISPFFLLGKRVEAFITCCTDAVSYAAQFLVVTATLFSFARQRQLITFIRVGGVSGPLRTQGQGSPSFISHPKLEIEISGGPCVSAAFQSCICSCTCHMC